MAAPLWQGNPLPSHLAAPWDGTGYGAIEVAAAILPTAPATPITCMTARNGCAPQAGSWLPSLRCGRREWASCTC